MTTDSQPVVTMEWPGFWRGKTPCWVLQDCSPYVYRTCAAYLHTDRPCWQHPVTQSEKVLNVPRDCAVCKVFELYHRDGTGSDQG